MIRISVTLGTVMALVLILMIWLAIVGLHSGVLLNPWIYGEMKSLEREKKEHKNKYLESPLEMANFNALSQGDSVEDYLNALNSDDIRTNYTAVYYLLYENKAVDSEFISKATPYLISFLKKDGNLLKRDSIYLLDRYKIQVAMCDIRPFLESQNPYLRIAAKEYFQAMGGDIDPRTDKDYIDWEARYNRIIMKNRVASVSIGTALTLFIVGLWYLLFRHLHPNAR